MKQVAMLLAIVCLSKAHVIDLYNKNVESDLAGHTKAMLKITASKLDLLIESGKEIYDTIQCQMSILAKETVRSLDFSKNKVFYELEDNLQNPKYEKCIKDGLAVLDTSFKEIVKDAYTCVNSATLKAKSHTGEIVNPVIETDKKVKDFMKTCIVQNENNCGIEKAKSVLKESEEVIQAAWIKLSGTFNFVFTVLEKGQLCLVEKVVEFYNESEKSLTDITEKCINA